MKGVPQDADPTFTHGTLPVLLWRRSHFRRSGL